MADLDIVARLRMTGAPYYQSPICIEAADEIERLAAQLVETGKVAINRGDKLIAANTEIEQLRARLESYRTRGRDLMLHDTEMKGVMHELKRRIVQDPEFRRSLKPPRSNDD